jgi:DNA-binding Lrp family transcriptional regulator
MVDSVSKLVMEGQPVIRAYVMIKAGAGEYFSVEKTIREEIAKLPGIKRVDGIFGRFDIIAEVEAEDASELSRLVTDKIKAISSVISTETFICH